MKIPALLLLLASLACAQTPWQLTDATLKSQRVDIRSIDALEVIYVDVDGHPRPLPANQLVAIEKNLAPTISPTGFLLQLANGQKWAGTPERMTNKQLFWQSPLLGEASFPLADVKQIIRQGSTSNSSDTTDDVIRLNNGDIVHGALTGIDDQQVTIQTTTAAKIAWTNIAAIQFAPIGTARPLTPLPENWQLNLDDGSVIDASGIRWSRLKVSLRSDNHDYSIDTTHVLSIQRRNGPVVFLSSLYPAENKQVPLLGSPWPAHFNEDLVGNPLSNAISVHAYSQVGWTLPNNFKTFHVQFAVPAELALADITVRIRMDGKVAFEQTHVHGGVVSPAIDLPLNQAGQLTLEVDTASPYRTQGWLTWLSPALLR